MQLSICIQAVTRAADSYDRCTRQNIPPRKLISHMYDTPNYTLLVCRKFKFDTCKFTEVILPAKYIIYAFKSYF